MEPQEIIVDRSLNRLHVKLVAAQAANRVIGNVESDKAEMSWPFIREDMKHFVLETKGRSVVYGSKTLSSFPGGKPLPKRPNYILSRTLEEVEDATIVRSVYEALLKVALSSETQVVCIGGAEVYEQFLPFADEISLTVLDQEAQGNRYFPEIDTSIWSLDETIPFSDEDSGYSGSFLRYNRRKPLPDVVVVANARKPEYWADLLAINTMHQCPFCPGGKTHVSAKIFLENQLWYAFENEVGMENAEHAFVIVPKQHFTRVEQLNSGELFLLQNLLKDLKATIGTDYGVLTLREGNPKATGASVYHLHYQYHVPESGKRTTMYFGPWSEE